MRLDLVVFGGYLVVNIIHSTFYILEVLELKLFIVGIQVHDGMLYTKVYKDYVQGCSNIIVKGGILFASPD